MDEGILKTPSGNEYKVIAHRAANQSARPKMGNESEAQSPRARRIEVLQWLQLGGIVMALLYIGGRDQDIKTMKEIVAGLVERDRIREREMGSLRSDVDNILRTHKP